MGTVGIVQISALFAVVLQQQEQSVFQRLREWYLDASHKSGSKQGHKRREQDVTSCFEPLLRWVVRLWVSEENRLPLVVDATSLGNRWTILAVSVVLNGGAIPVAWKVLRAEEIGPWRPYWEQLFAHLQGAIPPDWFVMVLADRGLYARWMWDAIVAQGWHLFLRINLGVKASEADHDDFDWISRWVPTLGTHWTGEVDCFAGKQSRLRATLLLHWEPGYESAWAVVTDLEPQQAQVSRYGLRTWIECSFKDFKRGLWGWQHCKMMQASYVERLWLAMALAYLWCLSVGCAVEQQQHSRLPLEARALPGATFGSSLKWCGAWPTALAGHDPARPTSGSGMSAAASLARNHRCSAETSGSCSAPQDQDSKTRKLADADKNSAPMNALKTGLESAQKISTCKGVRKVIYAMFWPIL